VHSGYMAPPIFTITSHAYSNVLVPTLIVLENAVCVSQLNTTIFMLAQLSSFPHQLPLASS